MVMIDQVATAIREASHSNPNVSDAIMYAGPEFQKTLASAAIAAMREPTNEMCDAADWQQQSEVDQYQRAIDAALTK